MAIPYRDQNWSANPASIRLRQQGLPDHPHKTGEYLGPDGVVGIMTAPPSGRPKAYNYRGFTWLEAVARGRLYRRSFEAEIGKRGLYKKCREFLAFVNETTQ